MAAKIRKYKHDMEHSYALGATLTYELLRKAPQRARRVYLHTAAERTEGLNRLLALCEQARVPVEIGDRAFNILSPKGNCFVIGEFSKSESALRPGDHIVLVNPSDAGNLGTILRTAVGFGFLDLAVVRPAVDFYDPRVIRASMGAAFHVRAEYFDNIEDYTARFPENRRYAFMLQSSVPLRTVRFESPFSLVFGNEASGLPDAFASFCDTVVIPHSRDIDSLNLPIAASIAMYAARSEPSPR